MKKGLTNTVGEGLNLPQETFSGMALIQLRGKRSVSIENHFGIAEYTDELVRVTVRRGCVRILGRGLTISHMTRRHLEIRGTIRAVELE